MYWVRRFLFNGTSNLQNANFNATPRFRNIDSGSHPDLFWALDNYERSRTQAQETEEAHGHAELVEMVSTLTGVGTRLETDLSVTQAQETEAHGHAELVETVNTLTGVVTRLETELTEMKRQHEEKLRELEMVNRNQNETILRLEEYQMEQQNIITTQMREINQMKESWREEHDINRSQNEEVIQGWHSLLQEVQERMHVQAGVISQQECRMGELEMNVEVQKTLISEQDLSLHKQQRDLQDNIRAYNQHQNTQRELESTVQRQTLKLEQLENSLRELGEVITNQKQSLSELKSDIPVQDQRLTLHESTSLKRDEKIITKTEKIIEYFEQRKEINRNLENVAAADGCTVSTHTQDTDCSQDSLGQPRKSSNTQMDMINQQEIPLSKTEKKGKLGKFWKTMRQKSVK